MKWVTWQDVRVDRIGCSWAIRRFVDPDADFVFVPVGQTPLPDDATPFDIPGVELSHHEGHASFHALVRRYAPGDAVLHRIARIVDEADTVQEATLEPAAAGLDLICRGIRGTSRDDHEAIARGALVYDALYAALTEGDGA